MGKKTKTIEEQREKIVKLKKEIKRLKEKVSELNKTIANEKAAKLSRANCNPAKANMNCNCRLHRAYRNYYMSHNPSDAYEVWLQSGNEPNISVSATVSESQENSQNSQVSRKKEKSRIVSWGKP